MCHRGGRGQRVRLRAVSAFLNNGLPVCAMREWVNRYTDINCTQAGWVVSSNFVRYNRIINEFLFYIDAMQCHTRT